MKPIKLTALALAACVLLAGCEERRIYAAREVTVEVASVVHSSNPKTNSKINLRIVGTQSLLPGQRLKCSREKAKKIEMGSKWLVREIVYEYPHSVRYVTVFEGVNQICESSK